MIMAPGPSFVVLVDTTVQRGRVGGLFAVAGSTTGLTCWAATSVLGLVALLRASDQVFFGFTLLGAGYLCWLGISTLRGAWRDRGLPMGADLVPDGRTAPSHWGCYRTGAMTSLANPKMAAVYLALFPQFLPPGGGTATQVTTLAGVQIALSTLWYLIVVAGIGAIRARLTRPRWRSGMAVASGSVLIVLGLHTLTLA
ncbi:LysE family translocator [Saccharopolyspora sp. NPDC047091]|uniref:LysE family translocator n=1 Tax=Saccharopolyspora sp. NPDC047091 TaxID=3155924 RepID=UPI0033FB9C1B